MLILSVLLLASPAFAQQLHFNKQTFGSNQKFDYTFKDYRGKTHNLSFYLPRQVIDSSHKDFRPYSNYEANTYIYNRILQHSRSLTNGVMLDVRRDGNHLNISASGPSQGEVERTLTEVRDLNRQAQKEYLARNYFIEDTSAQYVFPDHVTLAEKYIAVMRPVALAVRDKTVGMGPRESMNFALNFLQSIPYDTLMDRQKANGAGFVTPPALFDMNEGDCDTKSVALATILRNLYPTMRTMMIYTPGHAFIGLGIPSTSTDRTLNINGATFVLAEPAGPAILPLGMISPEAEADLRRNQYSYREIS